MARIIARLDVKNEFVIKGIQLEGLRKVGDPNEMAINYYKAGIDEIVFMDAVASLYDRNNLFDVISQACKHVFVPIAVGGGLRNLDDVAMALDAGADKVIVNTAAVRKISFITQIANKYGSQCIVGSIEAKKRPNKWEAFISNGRDETGLDVVVWAQELQRAGVGEILLTSVDKEGTGKGFDVELVEAVQEATTCPIIVSGGFGKLADLDELFSVTVPSGVAFGSALHYKKNTVADLQQASLIQR